MATSLPPRPSVPPPRPYQPYRLLGWLFARFFGHIQVDDDWTASVRGAASQGVVVYVMRSLSFLDFHCLDFLLKKWGLPLVRFVNDLGLWILEPFGKGFRRMLLQRQVPEEVALRQTLRHGLSALLFLRRPPRFGRSRRSGEKFEGDLIRTLVETQRNVAEPILLVPQTFVWTKLPARRNRSLNDIIFGPSEWPGRIRVFFQFLLNYRNARLRSGEPFNLRAFIEANQELTDAEIADKVRYLLLRRMERERTLVLGPASKTPIRMREEILRSPRIRKHIEHEARASGRAIERVENEARKDLQKLCADQNPYWLDALHRLLDWLWNRIYDGLVVDEEGLHRVRQAGRDGTLVFLPSHKSHVDYLVLSDVLYARGLSPPLIAAGDNLSFWPLGPVLRHAGGFFIRRSFRGKKLYAALLDAYLRKLVLEGFSIEFFLEGGRSRTGKLLPPKFGLLSMVTEAALMLRNQPVFFVPVSINYERIAEEREYVRELTGGEKEKENIGGLLRTPKVLRSNYGRLYVQFGEVVPLQRVLSEVIGEKDVDHITPSERRKVVQRIAHQTVYQINLATIVTPTALIATALLSFQRRGISLPSLVHTSNVLLNVLRAAKARVAPALTDDAGALRKDTLDEALALLTDGKLITRQGEGTSAVLLVPDERRIALEYYKNSVVHVFVPSALIASAVLCEEEESTSLHVLRERVRQLSRLFKYEFMYRADAAFEQIFTDTLESMLRAGELEQMVDHVRPNTVPEGRDRVELYAEMLRTYFEAYRLAAISAGSLLRTPLGRKEWLKKTMSMGQRRYLAGEVSLRESLAKPKLDNALSALHDLGLVALEGENAKLADATGSSEIEQLERQLAAFC